jgi:hypothetical protein
VSVGAFVNSSHAILRTYDHLFIFFHMLGSLFFTDLVGFPTYVAFEIVLLPPQAHITLLTYEIKVVYVLVYGKSPRPSTLNLKSILGFKNVRLCEYWGNL